MEREHFTPNEVQEYLAHIHYTGPIESTIEALTELQRCHILSVPFENLSVYGKEKIILSKDWLFDKIVRRNRGGFCYELNTLYSLLLDYFGFKYEIHAAVIFCPITGRISGRPSHMVPMINIEDDLWLSDVSFGDSYLTPLRFSSPPLSYQVQHSGIYRIRKEEDKYCYEEKVKIIVDAFGREEMAKEYFISEPGWATRYKFDLIPRSTGDFHEMLLFHQTDARSPFTHDRICTMATPWGRVTLSGSKVITSTYLGDNKVRKETKELLGGEEEIVKELEEKFGIRREACLYPEGSMFYGLEWSKETL